MTVRPNTKKTARLEKIEYNLQRYRGRLAELQRGRLDHKPEAERREYGMLLQAYARWIGKLADEPSLHNGNKIK